MTPQERPRSAIGGDLPLPSLRAETPLEALACLNGEARRDIAKLAPKVAAQPEAAGLPDDASPDAGEAVSRVSASPVTLTRRFALLSTLPALVSVMAKPSAAAAPARSIGRKDAALADLERRWREFGPQLAPLDDAASASTVKLEQLLMSDSRPGELRIRPLDLCYFRAMELSGRGLAALEVGEFFTPDHIEEIGALPHVWRPRDADRKLDAESFPEFLKRTGIMVPEIQARADEVVSAWKRWKSMPAIAEAQVQADAALDAFGDVEDEMKSIEDEIIEADFDGPVGLAAKARIVAHNSGADLHKAKFEDWLPLTNEHASILQCQAGSKVLDAATIHQLTQWICQLAERPAAAAPALAAPMIAAADLAKVSTIIDPVFAAIHHHRACRQALDAMPITDNEDGEPVFEATSSRELMAWRGLILTQPTTLAGLRAYAQHVSAYPAIYELSACDGPARALIVITAALAALKGASDA